MNAFCSCQEEPCLGFLHANSGWRCLWKEIDTVINSIGRQRVAWTSAIADGFHNIKMTEMPLSVKTNCDWNFAKDEYVLVPVLSLRFTWTCRMRLLVEGD